MARFTSMSGERLCSSDCAILDLLTMKDLRSDHFMAAPLACSLSIQSLSSGGEELVAMVIRWTGPTDISRGSISCSSLSLHSHLFIHIAICEIFFTWAGLVSFMNSMCSDCASFRPTSSHRARQASMPLLESMVRKTPSALPVHFNIKNEYISLFKMCRMVAN